MAKSSYALALLVAGWASEAQADPMRGVDFARDPAMQRYGEWIDGGVRAGCARGPMTDEEIVVCGRTNRQPERPPLPIQRDPGEIVRHINEPGRGVDALAADGCRRACDIGVQVNVIKAIGAVPKIIGHILHGDD